MGPIPEFGADYEILMTIALVILGIGVVVLILSLICYIFTAVSLSAMAKRRALKNPWLAWLPGGSNWIAANIADQYHYVVKGQVTYRRWIVLGLVIASLVLGSINSAVVDPMDDVMADSILNAIENGQELDIDALIMAAEASGGNTTVLSLVINAVEIATFVLWQMCLLDIYRSCNPDRATLFLVLGIIIPVTVPFFLFSCRKKEQGMPPRRDAAYAEPQRPTYQDPYGQAPQRPVRQQPSPDRREHEEFSSQPEQTPWDNDDL